MNTATPTPPGSQVMTRRLRTIAHVVLAVVAATGAALSYKSLYLAAAEVFDHSALAYGFPLLVDALVLGASLQYVAGCRTRSAGRHGWRATAHAGIAGTLLLNALAADTPAEVPWHVVAPAVWAVLVELYARTAAGQWKAERSDSEAIPVRLWLTAPIESARTWLRQARLTAAVGARFDTGRHAGAVEALRLTIPGRSGRRVRRVLRRQLRAGSLTPDAVLAACGWTDPGPLARLAPITVLRTALTAESAPIASGRVQPDRVPVGALSGSVEHPLVGSDPVGSVTPIESGRDGSPDRDGVVGLAPITDRVGLGRGADRIESAPDPVETGVIGRSPRPGDVERVRDLIAAGDLPATPSAEAIRKALGIGLPYARATRDALTLASHNGRHR